MQVKEHAMETIRTAGATPMRAAPIRLESRDDRLAGTMLAAEAVALAKGTSNKWHALACRIIGLTVEARAVFINALKAEKSALTKAQNEHGFDKKYSAGNTRSFSVELSKLSTIANAWNSGATVAGCVEFTNKQQADKAKHCPLVDNEGKALSDEALLQLMGYEAIVAYARTFSESKAGRKADTWAVKLGKWLTQNNPEESGTDAERAAYAAIVQVYNKLT